MQLRQMQRLIGVDVAKSGNEGLIEEQRLQSATTRVQGQVEAADGETALQRFRTEPAGHVPGHLW